MPSIQPIAVYEVPCNAAKLRGDIDAFYESENLMNMTESYRARLIPLALIEVVVSGADERFDVGDFTQEMELADEETWQVAYEEAFLSPDGKSLVRRDIGCADAVSGGRICFYFHFYDPLRPMLWTYGEFACPAPTPLPDHLAKLVPYPPI